MTPPLRHPNAPVLTAAGDGATSRARRARATGECLLMCLLHGTPRHAVVHWQPDPHPEDPVRLMPRTLPACLLSSSSGARRPDVAGIP
eukprot:COSAG01_NODE_7743_length_3076_cov_2.001344_1_plen_88_part_00